MSTSKFKHYHHGVAPYAQRCKPDEWQNHKDLITTLHEQRVTRRLMLEALNKEGFYPSMGQLVSKLRQWNFMVLGQRRISHQTAQPSPTEISDSLHSPNIQDHSSTEHAETADLGLVRSDKPVSSLRSNYLSHIHFQGLPQDEENRFQQPSGAGESTQSTSHDQQHNLADLSGSSRVITESVTDLQDLPELVDLESDIVSASPTTESSIGDYFRASDLTYDGVVRFADPYSSPADATSEDPLFGFHSNFCDAELRRKHQSGGPSTQTTPRNLISRIHYCCLTFFTNGAVGKSPSALYWHLLDECQSIRSLKYALTLIFIWGTSSPYSLQNNTKYRDLVRSAAEQFLPLTTRREFQNEYLDHVSARLTNIYSSLFDETFFLNKDGSPTMLSPSRGLTTLSLEDRRQDLLSYALHAEDDLYTEAADVDSDNVTIIRIASEARHVLLSKLGLILLYIAEVEHLMSFPTSEEEGTRRRNDSAWILASKLSSLLMNEEGFRQDALASIGPKLLGLDILTEAIGLVVADAFCQWKYGPERSVHGQESAVVSALYRLPNRNAQPPWQDCLTSLTMRIGLVEASRLCDSIRLAPDREDPWIGSLRSCRNDVLCRLLDSDITVFDRRVEWPSEPKSATVGARDSNIETVSIRSTSSSTSFSKLKEIASRLYLGGSTTSMLSVLSKWSGHASSQSWRLENVMQVDEIPLESIYTNKDRDALDQKVFEQMQGIQVS